MEFTKIALLAGFIIAFIFILVISNKNNPSSPDQFDEYQMTKRNTAFKISFCFLAIWVAISSAVFADGDIEGFPITYSMFSLIGLFITICIFSVYCIWTGCYLTKNTKIRFNCTLFGLVAAIQIYSGILSLVNGNAFTNGKLGIEASPLICGPMFLTITITLIIRNFIDKKELAD